MVGRSNRQYAVAAVVLVLALVGGTGYGAQGGVRSQPALLAKEDRAAAFHEPLHVWGGHALLDDNAGDTNGGPGSIDTFNEGVLEELDEMVTQENPSFASWLEGEVGARPRIHAGGEGGNSGAVLHLPNGTPLGRQEKVDSRLVWITFYTCETGLCTPGNLMYNGEVAYEGAAACAWEFPIGTVFTLDGDPTHRSYVCKDRGLGGETWVDIYFDTEASGWAWQEEMGSQGIMEQ